jgi:tetratricopeptide (TPR) repeat protein
VLRDGLTLESRRQHHAAVAQAIEALYPQRLEELADRLAVHWREAGDRSKAVDYLVRAGERLAQEQAAVAAATSFEKAVALLGQMAVPDRERMLALYLRIGEVCWKARKLEGDKQMEAAIELADTLGRRDYLARFSLLHGRFLVVMHRVDEGQRWLERAKELARVLDDRALTRDVLLGTAESVVKLGMHRQAIQSLRQALSLSEETKDLQTQMRCLTNLALTHATGGEPETGLGYIERARSLLRQQPDRFTECELFKMESLVCFFGGRWQEGIEAARRGVELAKEYDFTYEAELNGHNI